MCCYCVINRTFPVQTAAVFVKYRRCSWKCKFLLAFVFIPHPVYRCYDFNRYYMRAFLILTFFHMNNYTWSDTRWLYAGDDYTSTTEIISPIQNNKGRLSTYSFPNHPPSFSFSVFLSFRNCLVISALLISCPHTPWNHPYKSNRCDLTSPKTN